MQAIYETQRTEGLQDDPPTGPGQRGGRPCLLTIALASLLLYVLVAWSSDKWDACGPLARPPRIAGGLAPPAGFAREPAAIEEAWRTTRGQRTCKVTDSTGAAGWNQLVAEDFGDPNYGMGQHPHPGGEVQE